MRKFIALLLIVALSPLVFAACSGQQDVELGFYVAENFSATLSLQSDNEFVLYGPVAVSYALHGEYTVQKDKLILANFDGEKTIFTINKDELVFESGAWLGNWIEQGSILRFSNE